MHQWIPAVASTPKQPASLAMQRLVACTLEGTVHALLSPAKHTSAGPGLHSAAQNGTGSGCDLLLRVAAQRHAVCIALLATRSRTCTAFKFSRRAAAVKSALPMPTCTLPALSALYSTFPPLKSFTACRRAHPVSHHPYKGSSLQHCCCCSEPHRCAAANRLRRCGSACLTSEAFVKPCAAVLQSCNVDKDESRIDHHWPANFGGGEDEKSYDVHFTEQAWQSQSLIRLQVSNTLSWRGTSQAAFCSTHGLPGSGLAWISDCAKPVVGHPPQQCLV